MEVFSALILKVAALALATKIAELLLGGSSVKKTALLSMNIAFTATLVSQITGIIIGLGG